MYTTKRLVIRHCDIICKRSFDSQSFSVITELPVRKFSSDFCYMRLLIKSGSTLIRFTPSSSKSGLNDIKSACLSGKFHGILGWYCWRMLFPRLPDRKNANWNCMLIIMQLSLGPMVSSWARWKILVFYMRCEKFFDTFPLVASFLCGIAGAMYLSGIPKVMKVEEQCIW